MHTQHRVLKKLSFLFLACFLLLSSSSFSQELEETDTARNKILSAARGIMTSVESCALISLDQEGRPRVRAMDPFLPIDDFTVWLGTNANSRKVEQIKNDPRVTLYYLEDNDAGYVMIYGTAELVDDPEKKEKWWKPEWEAFYPDGREDYLLIKVTPEWMEVVSYTYDIHGNMENWEPPKVVFEVKE